MTRFADGPNIPPEQIAEAIDRFRAVSTPGAMFPVAPKENRYGFLFEDLQKVSTTLMKPENDTAGHLITLGQEMVDPDPNDSALNSNIPSGYTYLGQLIDHDLTKQSFPKSNPPILSDKTVPLSRAEIQTLSNARSVGLDLDCIYGPAIEVDASYEIPRDPKNDEKLKTELTAHAPADPELPREQASPHRALIGDRRNDENLIVSQLHLAFLLAHNKLVDEGETYETARQELRRHYQWLVVNDYLFRICDHDVVKSVLDGKLNLFDPPDDDTSLPLEFSVAAFRFGHSMIRDFYNYNGNFEKARLFQLLLPGFLEKYHHIPTEWTIDWRRFIDGRNTARRIDTTLARGLQRLDDGRGNVSPISLASIDLLKCYMLRVPTGEAVADRLGIPKLSTDDIFKLISKKQAEAIVAGRFEGQTPLWFYVLVEAHASGTGRLGRVGSSIVASVIFGLARKSRDSYLRIKGWTPTLGTNSRFDLPDLFQLAGLLPNNQ
jgi:hypothetical protein